MARLTIVFAVLLAVLGVAYFVMTGSVHKTALIPVWFGVALGVCGLLAKTEDARRRMLWMHIAVTVGLLGFLFPAIRGGMALAKAHSSGVELAAGTAHAVHEELIMAAICLVFVLLCVRSFIAARRARVA
jgi:TRAP-type C4-dicarboxylate transport system permease small subunit